ncbi:MAG TPA: hypothetical protein VLM88_01560 [Proteiniclasticum sp.]|nr:hypothetical protein [Proteiniclasticum sp.]
MWRKYGLNISALIFVLIIRIIVIPVVLPEEFGAYPRIMSYQMRRDYPMYDLVNLRNLESASIRSGYSMETLIAIDLLMMNQMNPDEAINGIEDEFKEIPMPQSFKMEQLPDKIVEVYDMYNRPVRFISILFEITMIIILSTIVFYLLFYLYHKKKLKRSNHLDERIN